MIYPSNYFTVTSPSSDLVKIHQTLLTRKITTIQFDPFGFCNSKCWFCPVKYLGNPERGSNTMSVDLLKRIFKMIDDERKDPDGLISSTLSGAYTAHYNEILLYKHLDVLFEVLEEYGMFIVVLSNGTTLTPDKTDLLIKHKGQLGGINLNIPAFNPKDWAIRTGFPEGSFNKLINNINYALEKGLDLSIQVNGINTDSSYYLTIGDKAPSFDVNTDLEFQVQTAKSLFPAINVYPQPYLIDRVGLIPEDVLSNKVYHQKIKFHESGAEKKVVGCSSISEADKGRLDWLHINAAGDVFFCCNDFKFEYIIGNLEKQHLRDFWATLDHARVVERGFRTLCTKCSSAVYE